MLTPHLAFRLDDLEALDAVSRMPLYAQLAETIAKRIRFSQAKLAGHVLPPEMETARHFGVSRPTVRQAMGQLLLEGLIVRGRGRGTFVAAPQTTRNFGRAFDFEALPGNQKVRFRLLRREHVAPDQALTDLFGLAEGEAVERIVRLRYVDDDIIALERRYLRINNSSLISDRMLGRDTGDVFVRGLIGSSGGHVAFRVRAVAADAEAARLMQAKKGSPLLASEHTYYDRTGSAVLCGVVLFLGDRHDLVFEAPVRGR